MKALALAFLASLVFASAAQANAPGYSYSGERCCVHHAVLSITSYTLSPTAPSHVAVWINVQKPSATEWIQVGIEASDHNGLYTYAETMSHGVHVFTPLYSVALGQTVSVRLSFSSHYGWVAWIDGKAVASLLLKHGVTFGAAERYGSASLTYTFR